MEEVVRDAKLTTWSVSGPRILNLAAELRDKPGVEQAVAFGTSLHVSGTDAEALLEAIKPYRRAEFHWTLIEPGLEDVFIQLMSDAPNGAAERSGGRATNLGAKP